MNPSHNADADLEEVASEILTLDKDGARTATVLRSTIDQLYDGQRTGRYRWDQLYKTEKTHCGTIVEINLHREFGFQDGKKLDYRIAGIEVDCKYSQSRTGWMIPPEARGHLCLVLWAEDSPTPLWSMGLVRASIEHLSTGTNRDGKAALSATGRASIKWLFRECPLPPNVLLQLDEAVVAKIMTPSSGQRRINELFRAALGMRVGRAVVATVAQQDDYMKRVRANGGARTALRPEGIVILGQYSSHRAIASALGVPLPGPGESVSVRITPSAQLGPGVALIDGRYWKIATDADPIIAAPDLPRV